jgi:ribosomal protein S18 acetylase RimI-like enzyme
MPFVNQAYTLQPFGDTFLDAAAQLLTQRHSRERTALPMLPERFSDTAAAHQAVAVAWQQPWSSGVAAVVGDELVGYLFGHAQFDQLLGRTVWMRNAVHALAETVPPDFYGDLYAAAAPAWLALGCFDHYLVASAADPELLDAWYGLGFGRQQAYGLRAITGADDWTEDEGVTGPGSVTIRRATLADRDAFSAMAQLTARHQVQAPVWAPLPAEIAAQRSASYAGVLDDEEAMLWLAEQDGRPVGFQIYDPAEPAPDDLHIPPQCAELPAAATLPELRGQGVGRALSRVAFRHLYQQGYTTCLVDWRTTNLLASRFWSQRGFQPAAYRLHRRIDERVLWAAGQ